MKKPIAYLLMLLMSVPALLRAQSWDTYSDTWVSVDGLGRKVADARDGIGMPNDRKVGMFYYIWHGVHNKEGRPIFDITEMLARDPDSIAWGLPGEFHWWGKPVLGYYQSGDRYVYAKHLQMLCDAGVDFLFFDVTNAYTYDDAVRAVMAEIDEREALGMKTPKLAYMVNAAPEQTIAHLYETFYADPQYDKYWFRYEGKPLMLADPKAASPEARERLTLRRSWAWMQGRAPEEWAWLEYYPQAPGWKTDPSLPEQLSVSVAQHATTKVGKSYHDGKQPPLDRYALCDSTAWGLYYAEQWEQAHRTGAPVLMITQFNEWVAMRFVAARESEFGGIRPGGPHRVGESSFVDTYNAEFNRDIEPSTHPLIRDNYYMQTVSNIRRYKGVRPIPTPSAPKTIRLGGGPEQWDDVGPEFRDDIGDIKHHHTQGCQRMAPVNNATGRNDIVVAKVARDRKNVYFYVRTSEPMTPPAESRNWMTLLLNADVDYATGWEGYDYAVRNEGGRYVLCRNRDGRYEWDELAGVRYALSGDWMHLAVPLEALGVAQDATFDFKWADNTPDRPDILDFITDGDVAPNGRFNYRYEGGR